MIGIGTRFYGRSKITDLPRLDRFVSAASKIGPVVVAVNSAEDKTNAAAFLDKEYSYHDPFVVALSLRYWGSFTTPLNTIIQVFNCTDDRTVNHVLFASVEFLPTHEHVAALLAHMDEKTLVAGARFGEHDFSVGMNEGTGVTVPWNTFALWNIPLLLRYAGGFPVYGDAPWDTSLAGVEEVTAIALAQSMRPDLTAKLVSVPGFYESWNTVGWDEERLQKHEKKIASKVSRPRAQLVRSGLPAPRVIHIA